MIDGISMPVLMKPMDCVACSITCLVVFLIDTENGAKITGSSSCDLCSSSLVAIDTHIKKKDSVDNSRGWGVVVAYSLLLLKSLN